MNFIEMLLRKKWFRSDAVWASSLLYRDPIRRVPLFFDTWALMKTQYWPRSRIDALAQKRLADIVRRVAHVPLWKQRFLEAKVDPANYKKDDLLKIRPLTKKDFYENDVSWYTDERLVTKSHVDHTSGSTGKPLEFRLCWRAELRYFAVRNRMFRSVVSGVKLPVVYFRGRVNPGFFFANHHLFYLKGHNDLKHRFVAFIEFVSKFTNGFVLYGYSSAMVELARRVSSAGVSIPLRAIIATGENIRSADRAYIEECLKTKFYLTYATWEVKWIGHECENHRLHINEEYVYVEILDENDAPLSPGQEGRIVITSFDSEAMPFIRYAVGDRGVVSEEYCSCGRTSRTLELFGRQSDVIELPDNRIVPLFDLSTSFDTFAPAVRQYRVRQIALNTFVIQVVPGPAFEELRDSLTMRLVSVLHPKAIIEWDVVDDIPQAPSGKAAYFVRAIP